MDPMNHHFFHMFSHGFCPTSPTKDGYYHLPGRSALALQVYRMVLPCFGTLELFWAAIRASILVTWDVPVEWSMEGYLWIIYGLSMELSMIINGYLWILSTMQWWMEGAIDKRRVWGILLFLMNRALPGASTARFHVTISQSQIVQKFFDRPRECFHRYVNHVISSPEVPFLGRSILGG